MKIFNDRLVLITGGSSGIGLALAKQFSSLGAHVWILARRPEMLQAAQNEIQSKRQSSAQRFGTISVDVSDHIAVNKELARFIAAEGVPDILVNSAGVVQPALFRDTTPEDFKWNMEINFYGTVFITQAVIAGMIQCASGTIVNISSMAGFLGAYGYTAYGASKYAVRGFSDALRAELKPLGINVHIVFPPDTDTPQLVYDNANKSYVTKELSSSAKVMSPDSVARSIINGISRRNYTIKPGFDTSFFYRLSHLLGDLTYPVMDLLISMAMRKERRAHLQRREQEGTHPDKV